ncbi:unnamed protein product, partial [Prorocentrum cordatum]
GAPAGGAGAAAGENHRTCGRASRAPGGEKGPLRVPLRSAARSPEAEERRLATIPARYETVLYRGNREQRGFGSQEPRFGVPDQCDPAFAGDHQTVRAGLRVPGSFGRRGAHGLASRSARLRRPKASASASVGPGSYANGPAPPLSAREAAASAAFVLPSSFNPNRLYERTPPGPSDYEPGRAAPVRARPSQNFQGKAERFFHLESVADDAPGPGAYSPRRPPEGRPAAAPGRPAAPAGAGPLAALGEVAAEVVEARLLPFGSLPRGWRPGVRKPEVPGPGEYDAVASHASATRGRDFATVGSASFQTGSSHLPRTWRPCGPGPGSYEAEPGGAGVRDAGAAARRGQSANFSSNTARLPEKVPRMGREMWGTPQPRPRAAARSPST